MARTVAVAPWTSPVVMGALVATADWKGVILQIVNVLIALAIYYPFFRAYDKMKLMEEEHAAKQSA